MKKLLFFLSTAPLVSIVMAQSWKDPCPAEAVLNSNGSACGYMVNAVCPPGTEYYGGYCSYAPVPAKCPPGSYMEFPMNGVNQCFKTVQVIQNNQNSMEGMESMERGK